MLNHPVEVAVGQDDDEDEPVVEGGFLPSLDKLHAHVVTGHVGESRDLMVVNLDEGQEAHQVERQVLHGSITRDELRDTGIQCVHLKCVLLLVGTDNGSGLPLIFLDESHELPLRVLVLPVLQLDLDDHLPWQGSKDLLQGREVVLVALLHSQFLRFREVHRQLLFERRELLNRALADELVDPAQPLAPVIMRDHNHPVLAHPHIRLQHVRAQSHRVLECLESVLWVLHGAPTVRDHVVRHVWCKRRQLKSSLLVGVQYLRVMQEVVGCASVYRQYL